MNGKNILLVIVVLLVFSPWSHTQEMPRPPGLEGEIGVMEGVAFSRDTQGRTVSQPDLQVVLVVFHKDEQVLMLNKQTDPQGRFEFKNIFQDSSYSYAVGAMYEDKPYVATDLVLPPGQKVLKIDLELGASSPYLMAENMMGKKAAESLASSQSTASGFNATQKQTLVLAALVLVIALAFALS